MLDVGVVVGHNLDHRAAVAHAHLDVALVIRDVEQPLEVIRGDVRLLVELVKRLVVSLHHVGTPYSY